MSFLVLQMTKVTQRPFSSQDSNRFLFLSSSETLTITLPSHHPNFKTQSDATHILQILG